MAIQSFFRTFRTFLNILRGYQQGREDDSRSISCGICRNCEKNVMGDSRKLLKIADKVKRKVNDPTFDITKCANCQKIGVNIGRPEYFIDTKKRAIIPK